MDGCVDGYVWMDGWMDACIVCMATASWRVASTGSIESNLPWGGGDESCWEKWGEQQLQMTKILINNCFEDDNFSATIALTANMTNDVSDDNSEFGFIVCNHYHYKLIDLALHTIMHQVTAFLNFINNDTMTSYKCHHVSRWHHINVITCHDDII